MAVLTKRDLGALFALLALVYLFDSIAFGFVVLGLVVFIIMIAAIWFSMQPSGMNLMKKQSDSSAEWLPRGGLILVLLGVLIANAWILAIGFFVAEVLLFLPNESWNVDAWTLSMTSQKSASTKKGRK